MIPFQHFSLLRPTIDPPNHDLLKKKHATSRLKMVCIAQYNKDGNSIRFSTPPIRRAEIPRYFREHAALPLPPESPHHRTLCAPCLHLASRKRERQPVILNPCAPLPHIESMDTPPLEIKCSDDVAPVHPLDALDHGYFVIQSVECHRSRCGGRLD